LEEARGVVAPSEHRFAKQETMMADPMSPDLLKKMYAYWRAANYLAVRQIYLQDNPLLEAPTRA
jgi:phosphoketolase